MKFCNSFFNLVVNNTSFSFFYRKMHINLYILYNMKKISYKWYIYAYIELQL